MPSSIYGPSTTSSPLIDEVLKTVRSRIENIEQDVQAVDVNPVPFLLKNNAQSDIQAIKQIMSNNMFIGDTKLIS